MSAPADVLFMVDVDNTLLDNDRLLDDFRQHLEREFGPESASRYWAIRDELRRQLGYMDYFGALQRYRVEAFGAGLGEPKVLQVAEFLLDYPFADRLYADSLGAIAHLQRLGPTVLLSDGDAVFQPRKVRRSGLQQAVAGQVLIYIHKELMLDAVRLRYPARHHVMVDDKLRILTAMKAFLGDRLTTVFVRQGQYALDPNEVANNPPADITIDSIGGLQGLDLQALRGIDAEGKDHVR